MFFTMIRECFTWSLTPLSLLVNATITIFVVIVAVQVIKSLVDLLEFLAKNLRRYFYKGGATVPMNDLMNSIEMPLKNGVEVLHADGYPG